MSLGVDLENEDYMELVQEARVATGSQEDTLSSS